MKSATLYKTDGTIETIQPKNGETFSLEELQKYVGGYIEYVHLKDGKVMVVNEEGKCLELPTNENADKIFHEQYPNSTDWIVGDVVVCDFVMA